MVEYCGQDYVVDLATSTGATLYARTAQRLQQGAASRWHVAPDRVLVFPRG
jgi:hypothetical protein